MPLSEAATSSTSNPELGNAAPSPLSLSEECPATLDERATPVVALEEGRAREHLQELLSQCLKSCKINEQVWKDIIMACMDRLSSLLTAELLNALSASRRAVWRAEAAIVATETGTAKEKQHASDVEPQVVSSTSPRPTADRRRLREVWSAARLLLPEELSDTDEGTGEIELGATGWRGHAAEATMDSTWSTIADLPKLDVFRIAIASSETTMGAVKSGLTSLSVDFVSEARVGAQPLFGVDEVIDLSKEDLKNITLRGGTFNLSSLPKDRPRLERVLELFTFATISLKIEAHLLHAVMCPRLPLPALSEPEPSSPATPTPTDAGDSSRPSLSHLPSEEWSTTETSRRKKVVRALWGALLGSSRPSAPLVSPPSASSSSVDAASPLEGGPPDSTTRSTPSSDSSIPIPTARRMKDKLRGFGESFRIRRHRGNGGEEDLASQEDTGWDFLASVGLSLSTPKAEKEIAHPESTRLALNIPQDEEEPTDRFEKVLKKMSACILSTSPDVLYPPPFLLLRMVQAAAATRKSASGEPVEADRIESATDRPYAQLDAQRLALDFASGDSTAPAAPSTTDSGLASSSAARIGIDVKTGLASLLTNNNSLSGVIRHQQLSFLAEKTTADDDRHPCISPHTQSFAFYQTQSSDTTLGRFISDLLTRKDDLCQVCGRRESEHSLVLMHGKSRISVTVTSNDDGKEEQRDDRSTSPPPPVSAWTTCANCLAETSPRPLSDIASLYSVGMWLQLLLYDQNFAPPELCSHDRAAYMRRFGDRSTFVSIRVDPIDLYELRLPAAVDPDVQHRDEGSEGVGSSTSPLAELRADIDLFFTSVFARLDDIRNLLDANLHLTEFSQGKKTDHPSPAPSRLRRDSDATIIEMSLAVDEEPERSSTASAASPVLHLLEHLREVVQRSQMDCLTIAEEQRGISAGRSYFRARAFALKRRVEAWEIKHHAELGIPLDPAHFLEPDYFATTSHLIPVETSVVVRESELSSLIALTLSARPFIEELANPTESTSDPSTDLRDRLPSLWERPSDPSSRKHIRQSIPSEFLHPESASAQSSRSPSPMSASRQSSSSLTPVSSLDPDDSDSDFSSEAYISFQVKRRKRAKPGSRMLGTLTRQRSTEGSDLVHVSPAGTPTKEGHPMGSALQGNRVSSLSDSVLESLVSADSSTDPTTTSARTRGRAVPSIISSLRQPSEATTSSTLSFSPVSVEPAHSRYGTISSLSSLSSLASRNTSSASSLRSVDPAISEDGNVDPGTVAEAPPLERASRFLRASGTLTSTLSSIMTLPDTLRRGSGGLPESSDAGDPSEHIKFAFTSGTSSFRVTAWYAERFAKLRAKCGLPPSLFSDSLERCDDLNPSGGKSSAAFLITKDKRFLLKELVTAWGVSERDSFLSFAPKLLEYTSDADRPSLLCKILGFYSLKIVKSGSEVRKMDLVVMENIFYGREITRQFDLKGIRARTAKAKAGDKAVTGWDDEWLSQRFLLHSHSKNLLRTALEGDTTFLSSHGGIDYSLLLGVDDEKKELVVGLIDTLGVFDLRKRLESQLKTGIKLASRDIKEVTVVPPHEYSARFVRAMESSFLAVPDAWAKVDPARPQDPDPRLACPV